MPADGCLPAQVQGYAPYRTGVARTEARQGPLAGSHNEAEGRGPASPFCDAGRGARAADAGERLSEHAGRGARRQGRRTVGRGEDPGPRGGEARYARAEEHYLESLWSKSGGWGERWGTTGRGKTAAALTVQGLATRGFAVARRPLHTPETKGASPLAAKSYRFAARSPVPVARRRSAPKTGLPWATGGCGWLRRCSR